MPNKILSLTLISGPFVGLKRFGQIQNILNQAKNDISLLSIHLIQLFDLYLKFFEMVKRQFGKIQNCFWLQPFFWIFRRTRHNFYKRCFLLFSDAMETPDSASLFVEELHKRWFDNVKEYLDKKRERVENSEKAQKKMMC